MSCSEEDLDRWAHGETHALAGSPVYERGMLILRLLRELDEHRRGRWEQDAAHYRDRAERAEARITALEGHRKQWRNHAFQLLDVLNSVDAYADYPESIGERLREVRAVFDERSAESNSEVKESK